VTFGRSAAFNGVFNGGHSAISPLSRTSTIFWLQNFLQVMHNFAIFDVRTHRICYSFWGTKSPDPLPGLRPWTLLGTSVLQTPDFSSPFLNSKYATGRNAESFFWTQFIRALSRQTKTFNILFDFNIIPQKSFSHALSVFYLHRCRKVRPFQCRLYVPSQYTPFNCQTD